MIRIIKSKTYNGMKDQINRLNKQILKQQNELSSIKNNSAVKNTIIAEMEEQIYNLKKENLHIDTFDCINAIHFDIYNHNDLIVISKFGNISQSEMNRTSFPLNE